MTTKNSSLHKGALSDWRVAWGISCWHHTTEEKGPETTKALQFQANRNS